jgi:hypothetical protein
MKTGRTHMLYTVCVSYLDSPPAIEVKRLEDDPSSLPLFGHWEARRIMMAVAVAVTLA